MLGAVAAVTDRLRLGTAVVLAPFQHPLRFAEDCAVVDQLSRGRLIVGLGAGWRKREFASFGIPIGERVGRTTELARICRAAWDQERFSFRGKYFQLDDVSVTPKPFGHLPLLLGGNVPAAAARAGRLADGYVGTASRLDQFRGQVEVFDRAARDAGRDPARLSIGFHMNAWISADGGLPSAVRAAMWHQIGTYATWHAQDDGSTSEEVPLLDEAVVRGRTFIGTPEAVVAQVRPWIEEFATRDLHVILRLHYPGMTLADAEPAVRLLGKDVIPELKRIRPLVATP
jgi:alkanesulfonate monooxygenase SsuD/methylene tetrahydromethanopterin reductase-like flavin-dependent oxidoreductase (luciferase family)